MSDGAAALDWRSQLIINDKKKPRAILANAITAFREAPEWSGRLWFDAFHQKAMLRGAAPWMIAAADEEWSSQFDVLAADWLQHQGIQVSPDTAAQAIDVVARERRFHPVQEYLGRCKWDGEPRLDTWTVRYLGAEDTPFGRAVAPRWMISAIARVSEPGCKADCALILEGPQGGLKSTALKTLAQPWFTDEVADLGTKDAALQLAGAWVLELAELDSISRSDVAKIKAFMSRTTDRFRPPYGRRVVEVPRQCVFAGTVNLTEYLRDETGGRRFWPITCGKINIAGLADARDQLWAEARDRYLAEERWWLDTAALDADAREAQRARYQSDAWEPVIGEWLGIRDSVSVAEVLKEGLRLPVERWGQIEANRVARCLRALGWERYQERRGTQREWRYRQSEGQR
jgi:predicted P-loop ATPase